jgi:signal transduction histidine kinase
LKYGGDRLGRIETRYEESDEFHIISVSDDGAGIKGQNTEKIFEIFQRNVDSKEIAGTGLGLSIVKEIAERHRGKVWVEPGLDKGTTFYISISKLL